jgi:hypothetical protein
MKVTRQKAIQVHPVPDIATSPKGPFPPELFREPEIVDEYPSQYSEDGSEFELGATAQNNYKPPKHLRCGYCFARVLETETKNHICEE